ncbi:MAG: LamG domain-containing protein [Planctomycetota bacterium]
MAVSDTSTFDIGGPVGGPFDVVARSYELVNRTEETVSWSASSTQPWLVLDESEGVLGSGESASLDVTIDQALAAALGTGTHSGQVVVRGDGAKEIRLSARLVVSSSAGNSLIISGDSGIDRTAELGSPIDAVSFQLSNDGTGSVDWQVAVDASWLVLPTSWSGSIAAGEQSTVDLALDDVVLGGLGIGNHSATVTFTHSASSSQSPPTSQSRIVGVQLRDVAGPVTGRVTNGLIALYDFEEGNGSTVRDVSGVGTPLDLTVQDPASVTWVPGGLRLDQATVVRSGVSAVRMNDAIRAHHEVTFEAWIDPANLVQEGPARVMTLSNGAHDRNFTLGQGLWGGQPSDTFSGRLRTLGTNDNGDPMLATPGGTADPDLQHVAFTMTRYGIATIYVDGVEVANHSIGTSFDNWDTSYEFALGNEIGADRAWLGSFHLVAVYERCLSAPEIQQNYAVGPLDPNVGRLAVTPAQDFNVTFIEGNAPDPDSAVYQIANAGTATTGWEVSVSQPWIFVRTGGQGRLDATEHEDLEVKLDAATLQTFAPGTYTATVDIVNTLDGFGNTQRDVTVVVLPEGSGNTGEKPGPHNTGPLSDNLTPMDGYTIREDGTTLENVAINGPIRIEADNVTIRNFRLDGGGATFGIYSREGGVNLLIEDGEIVNCSAAGIAGRHWTARRLNIHEMGSDGVKCDGTNIVENCWIHHLGRDPGAHADGNQTRGGGGCHNIVIRGNNFDMPIPDGPNGPGPPYASNATLFISTAVGTTDNVLIEGNWMNGGNFTVYLRDKQRGYGPPSNVTMINNRFGRDYRHGVLVNDPGLGAIISGNVWDDTGELMGINNQ